MEGAAVIGVAVTRASMATPHTHTHASAATPASAASSHLLALQAGADARAQPGFAVGRRRGASSLWGFR